MPKVFIGVGHGGKDPGAVGKVKEADANLYMALGMKEELERNGYAVGISRVKDENDPLTEEIKESNAFGADIAVEVHNNAGGGDGFEVFVQTNKYANQSKRLAQCIEAEVKKTGQKSRGIKTRLNGSGTDYFGWLRQNNRPAVLCEGFFVDSADANDYNTVAKQKDYGKAYARGVMAYFGYSAKPVDAKYTIQCLAASNANNATKLKNTLSEVGYYSFILRESGLNKVCVGKFTTAAEAEKTVVDLKKKGFDGFVRKV